MDERTPANFNSPVIQRNTPLKRLGLSRKRKTCESDANSSINSQPGNYTPIKRLGLSRLRRNDGLDSNSSVNSPYGEDKFPSSRTNSPNDKVAACDNDSKDVDLNSSVNESKDVKDENSNETIDYDNEIEILTRRVMEKEEKLKLLQAQWKNLTDLENLFELWRNGCKNAYLHLIQLLKEREPEKVKEKDILNNLGIWDIMIENFGDDSDLSLFDYSQ